MHEASPTRGGCGGGRRPEGPASPGPGAGDHPGPEYAGRGRRRKPMYGTASPRGERVGKRGHEGAGGGSAATRPEAGGDIARGCLGGARPESGGGGPKGWPGRRGRGRKPMYGTASPRRERVGKRGHEAAGGGSAATRPEARGDVARDCLGGARPESGGGGPKGWPGRRGRGRKPMYGTASPRRERVGKRGHEAAGGGSAATRPEAGGDVARGCLGGARPESGDGGPEGWPGRRRGRRKTMYGNALPPRGERVGNAAGSGGAPAWTPAARPARTPSQEAKPC